MPDPGVLVPRQFYSDLLKMHSEWRRKPKNAPIQRGRWPVGGAGGTPTRIITFMTASALLASDSSQADCPVMLVWYGADPGDTVTITNELGFAADAGVEGYAMYCPPDGRWKIWQIPCPVGTS